METASASRTFASLDLSQPTLESIAQKGYQSPTDCQAEAIPLALAGKDLVVQSRTGTGKTAAFGIPVMEKADPALLEVQAPALVPTRELALQVAEAVRSYGKHLGNGGVHVLPIYGGQPIHIQRNALQRGVHVVIGTPGRVRDHLERGTLSLKGVRFFGLDEADEMLKMGFIEDVEWILEHAPEDRQISLFSYHRVVMGVLPTDTRGTIVSEIDPEMRVVLARNPLGGEFTDGSIRAMQRSDP